MIEQLNKAIKFFAFFTAAKVGVTGLSDVTVDVYEPGGTLVATAQAATELGGGLYTYTLASGSVTDPGAFAAIFKTADGSVDLKHVPSLISVGVAGVDNLDATISSRNATAPDSAATIATAVWASGTRSLTTFGTLVADTAAAVWAAAIRTLTSASVVRTELATELARVDVAVSTRNATTPPTAAVNAAAVRTELSTELARIDTTISSRNATAPDSAATIATAVWASGTRSLTTFGTLVADTAAAVWAVVTRTLTSGAAPSASDNATAVWAAGARTLTSGAAPSVEAIADAVWDEPTAGHVSAGSTGAAIVAAGAGGDPWSTTVPGAYADGTAGALFGRLAAVDGDGPVIVVPAAPTDLSLCRVFAYVENTGNADAGGVEFTFELISAAAIKSERLIADRTIKARSNSEGYLQIDLQRNDLMLPVGSVYHVTCPRLKLKSVPITLAAETYDLSSLIA